MAPLVLRHQVLVALDDSTLSRVDAIIRRGRREADRNTVDRADIIREAVSAYLDAIGQHDYLRDLVDMPPSMKALWLSARQIGELFGITASGALTKAKSKGWLRREQRTDAGRPQNVQFSVPRDAIQDRVREIIREHSQVNRITVVEEQAAKRPEVRKRHRLAQHRTLVGMMTGKRHAG